MRKKIKEVLQILSAVILMSAGLGLVLNFTNGLLLIGLGLIAGGSLILFVIARGAVVGR